MPADGDQVKMVATTAKTSLASVGRGSQSCRHVSGMSPNVGACLQGAAAPLTMARLLPQSKLCGDSPDWFINELCVLSTRMVGWVRFLGTELEKQAGGVVGRPPLLVEQRPIKLPLLPHFV